ncbi:hypothetical protein B9Z19DRAFT_1128774 [Tuber borchii]|uniref:Uncharacterized protein n=1 Tax=Tuber borchii TaxID=42251 RepID=A0A2T6ZNT4_TUBBO|nr:hypothetical protein B9Z19DRAFT_1128774 [Tuber borchii]
MKYNRPAMASLLPCVGQPSLTPLSMIYPHQTTSSENQYAPSTSSPLSPHSILLPPLETSATTTGSHYYRPALSAISSSTHSPSHASRQFREQSLLATDALLCNLTPAKIIRLSASGEVDFEPREKELSLRAAWGTVKVNEWLDEVECWNREWRQTYRESKDAGDGYLPPADRPKKQRKRGMGGIREEEEGTMLDSSKPVGQRLYSEDNGTGGSRGVITKDDTPEVGAVEPQERKKDSPGVRRGGKPLAPYQLKMQRQRAAEVGNGGRSVPDQILVNPVEKIGAKEEREEEEEVEDEDEDDELYEGVEYWGSLKRSTIEGYEARIEVIKSEIEELDVDGLKYRFLSYGTSAADLLTDSAAIMTTTTLQLLPPLSRLRKLLSAWVARIAVLRIVPAFLGSLQMAKDALEAGYTAITHPSINPESSSLDGDWRGLAEESYKLMQEIITQKVAKVGMIMDTMLDVLEGREDVLPDSWIDEVEDVEKGFSHWVMDGERVVLEGRLRLEEMTTRWSQSEKRVDEKRETEAVVEAERHQPAPERVESEEITKLAEAEEKTLEAEARKVAELGAQRLAEEEEFAETARLELEAEKADEAKRFLIAQETAQKEHVAELERLAEGELEDVEKGVSRREMDGERVVLEGRLRLEEMKMPRGRRAEEARQRERALLVLGPERGTPEARAEGVTKMLPRRNDVSPDKPESNDETPPLCASMRGHGGVVKIPLGQGDVNPHTSDVLGRTPLRLAAKRGEDFRQWWEYYSGGVAPALAGRVGAVKHHSVSLQGIGTREGENTKQKGRHQVQ